MIISKGFLEAISRDRNIDSDNYDPFILNNMRMVLHNQLKKDNKYNLFLSHSSLDKTLVVALINIFNEAGYCVYVDWIDDPELNRDYITKETAELIKKRLECSQGLSLITTKNSLNSKWCPWELGLADGMKRGKSCLLPVTEKYQLMYHGQEYLGIYPYLDYEINDGNGKSDFFVNNQNLQNKKIRLSEWLAK